MGQWLGGTKGKGGVKNRAAKFLKKVSHDPKRKGKQRHMSRIQWKQENKGMMGVLSTGGPAKRHGLVSTGGR